jgi:formate C-acetyltransferase
MKGTAGNPKRFADERCWRDFAPSDWCRTIDVQDFIAKTVTLYSRDKQFLADASERTKAVWKRLQPYFQTEQIKNVLAVDVHSPSTMLAYKPCDLSTVR